jgi:hypothetical protein
MPGLFRWAGTPAGGGWSAATAPPSRAAESDVRASATEVPTVAGLDADGAAVWRARREAGRRRSSRRESRQPRPAKVKRGSGRTWGGLAVRVTGCS